MERSLVDRIFCFSETFTIPRLSSIYSASVFAKIAVIFINF